MSFTRPAALALLALLTLAPGCDTKSQPSAEETAKVMESKLADAEAMVRNNQLGPAGEIYAWVIEQDESRVDGWRGLGRVRLAEKNTDEAIELLQKAASIDAADGPTQAALGDALVAAGRHGEAAAAYAVAFTADPEDARLGLHYGVALRESGDAAGAEKILRQVIEVDENIQHVFTELGDTLRAQKRADEALKAYMRAQKLHGSDKRAHAGAAFAFEELGKYKSAADEWSMYIRMDGTSEYSATVARPKLQEVQKKEQAQLAGDTKADTDDGDEG